MTLDDPIVGRCNERYHTGYGWPRCKRPAGHVGFHAQNSDDAIKEIDMRPECGQNFLKDVFNTFGYGTVHRQCKRLPGHAGPHSTDVSETLTQNIRTQITAAAEAATREIDRLERELERAQATQRDALYEGHSAHHWHEKYEKQISRSDDLTGVIGRRNIKITELEGELQQIKRYHQNQTVTIREQNAKIAEYEVEFGKLARLNLAVVDTEALLAELGRRAAK